MDFLACLLMHIPQPSLHTVRYYAHYSSVARARMCAKIGLVGKERHGHLGRGSRQRTRV